MSREWLIVKLKIKFSVKGYGHGVGMSQTGADSMAKQGSNYDDIINLSRPKSNRPSMPIDARAAQFAPFSALTGYSEAIVEVGRFTTDKRELSDGLKENINEKLRYIKDNCFSAKISISYFVKDKTKSGGEYITVHDYVKKIDSSKNIVILKCGKYIYFDGIISIDIDCDCFDD